jgi:hypothetical protein
VLTTTSILLTTKTGTHGIELSAQLQIFLSSSGTGSNFEVLLDETASAILTLAPTLDSSGNLTLALTSSSELPILAIKVYPTTGSAGTSSGAFAAAITITCPGAGSVFLPCTGGTQTSSTESGGGVQPSGGATLYGAFPTPPDPGSAPIVVTLSVTI